MNRSTLWILTTVLSIAAPVSATAGANANGTVRVTWDQDGKQSGVDRLRSLPFPVFIQLEKTPDVRELAVTLEWMPYDPKACTFQPIPDFVNPDQSSGWAVPLDASREFDGDPGYDWQILLPMEGSGRHRVAWWFTVVGCDSVPRGRFFLTDVRTKDSDGKLDRLRIVGQATVRGGPLPRPFVEPQPRPVARIQPASTSFFAAPNPAVSTVELRYALAGTRGMVEIYDVAGRLRRQMEISPRNESVEWDLSDRTGMPVRGGLYFARLVTPTGIRTVRFVVLR